jgi:hypothetical protein
MLLSCSQFILAQTWFYRLFTSHRSEPLQRAYVTQLCPHPTHFNPEDGITMLPLCMCVPIQLLKRLTYFHKIQYKCPVTLTPVLQSVITTG